MVKDVRKININVDAYNYRYPMRYLYVYMYIRTMETIVSINIGSVPDAYLARTIYVSKHVPWKAPCQNHNVNVWQTLCYRLPCDTVSRADITRCRE